MIKKISKHGPLAWMARNHVAANLIMIVLLAGGAFMSGQIKQEVFPEVTIDMVTISVAYPGAAPDEVERGVILAIEDAVMGLDGVKRVTSSANESSGSVVVELLSDADTNVVRSDIENAVNRISNFPNSVERPIISIGTTRSQVISMLVYGELNESELYAFGEEVRSELQALPGITLVEVSGNRPPEISIEVPQDKLLAHNLTLQALAAKIASASIDLPAGGVKTSSGEVLVRTKERRDWGSEFEEITAITKPDGTIVRLRDLANVKDTFQENDAESVFNGQRALTVEVYRVGDQTPLGIAAMVKTYLAQKKASLPDGVGILVWSDRSEIYAGRMGLLIKNGKLGLILVLVVLGLFLDLRLAFWVTMGIPISFLGAMLFLPTTDVSINMMSLFAFILTLGIVVDDAIVVGEAIYKHRQEGMPPLPAAIAGVREVAMPVVFSVLTTIVAFAPLLFLPGVMGKFSLAIPVVVILVLFLSLVESLFVLPAHLAHLKQKPRGIWGLIGRVQGVFARGVERFVEIVIGPVVHLLTTVRYLTFALAITALVVTVGYVRGGGIKASFMPKIEGDRVTASVRMPFGHPIQDTRKLGEDMAKAAEEVFEEMELPEEDIKGILVQTGAQSVGGGPGGRSTASGSHLAQVQVSFVSAEERDFHTADFSRRWREKVGEIPGAETLTFKFNIGPAAGSPIDIELSHSDIEVLEEAAVEVAAELAEFNGVKDIDSGVSRGKEQLNLTLKPSALAMGITEVWLARELRAALYGAEITRQQRGREELRIYVRLPKSERISEYDIENMLITAPNGEEIPLSQAVEVERGRAYTSISRRDGLRVINVTADIDEAVTNAQQVLNDAKESLMPEVLSHYKGLSYRYAGEQEEQAEFYATLGRYYAMALFVMFALMAIVFRSYVQPLVIMISIPFGVIGALWGHIIMGYDMSMMSMLGIVALSGVVINDSIVLIDATNRYRREGMSAHDAVIAGAMRRFRPILLTTLTTFFGLVPMIAEESIQAKFLVPMAISLGFGILFTTYVIIIVVPSIYLIVEDFKRIFAWVFNKDKDGHDEEGDDPDLFEVEVAES